MADCTKSDIESEKVKYTKESPIPGGYDDAIIFLLVQVKDDWKFVATVMDRMFLWIFTLAVCGENNWRLFVVAILNCNRRGSPVGNRPSPW